MQGGGTISEEYKRLLQRTHAESPGWGTTAYKTAAHLLEWTAEHSGKRLLDYGCGKSSLRWHGPVEGYDPGIPGKDTLPEGPFDIVACVDVLEHVEPEYVDAVVEHLCSTAPLVYIVVDTYPAKKILPDGRNAHLTQMPMDFWRWKFEDRGMILENGSYDGRRFEALYARA